MRGGSGGIYTPILVVFGVFFLKVAPGWGFLRPPAFRQAAGVGRDVWTQENALDDGI